QVRSKRRARAASGTHNLISISRLPCGMAPLLGAIALMIFAEMLIDGFAARKPVLYAVPEGDRRFAELPAEINLLAFKQSREVHQPGIQILHDAAQFLHFLNDAAQAGGGFVTMFALFL